MSDTIAPAHTNGHTPTHSQPSTPRSSKMEPQQEILDAVLQQHADSIQYIQSHLTNINYNHDYTDKLQIYRFLKGYKFDRSAALDAVRASLQFRAEHEMDAVRQYVIDNFDTIEQLKLPHAVDIAAAYPHTILHGYDKYNRPLSVERIGYTNLQLLTQTVTIDQFVLYQLYHVEYKAEMCKRLSYKHNRVIRTAKIMDLAGLSRALLNKTGLHYLKSVVHGAQIAHPELLGRLYLINANAIFRFAWTLVKPMLNAITISKIQILGDAAQYQPVLSADIDANSIPKQYGGSCTSCANGCIIHPDADRGFTTVTVKKGSTHTEHVTVTEQHLGNSGCTVQYKFRTDSHNIAFRYVFAPAAAGHTRIESKLQRYDSNAHMVVDSVELKQAGTLTLVFDNTYSMFTSKTLHYMVHVQTNETTE